MAFLASSWHNNYIPAKTYPNKTTVKMPLKSPKAKLQTGKSYKNVMEVCGGENSKLGKLFNHFFSLRIYSQLLLARKKISEFNLTIQRKKIKS